MARMTQINIDASRLQGVDFSKVPNKTIPLPKSQPNRLNGLSANVAKASISAAANVSTVGEWAAIPQDFGSGSLKATMVLPLPPGSPSTSKPVPLPAQSVAVTIGFSMAPIGPALDGGLYAQSTPREFGLLGSAGIGLSTSIGFSVPVDFIILDGPISLLDGFGMLIVVDVGLSKTLFAGLGILVSLPLPGKIIGFVCEMGAGNSIGPTETLNVSVTYGGNIKLL